MLGAAALDKAFDVEAKVAEVAEACKATEAESKELREAVARGEHERGVQAAEASRLVAAQSKLISALDAKMDTKELLAWRGHFAAQLKMIEAKMKAM